MTSEKPRRRWFRPRFSLATLLIVVTAAGASLGYAVPKLKVVRERARVLACFDVRHDVCFGRTITTRDFQAARASVTNRDWNEFKLWDGNDQFPGRFRKWLGDKPISVITMGPSARPDYCSAAELRRLFPEATIYSLRNEDRE